MLYFKLNRCQKSGRLLTYHERKSKENMHGEEITLPKEAVLDFVMMVYGSMYTFVTAANSISGYRTDYSTLALKLKLHENERGRGYWKFNNSLLKDNIFGRDENCYRR